MTLSNYRIALMLSLMFICQFIISRINVRYVTKLCFLILFLNSCKLADSMLSSNYRIALMPSLPFICQFIIRQINARYVLKP